MKNNRKKLHGHPVEHPCRTHMIKEKKYKYDEIYNVIKEIYRNKERNTYA